LNSLAIISTHPIQYYAPIFRLLAEKMDGRVKVFYETIPDSLKQGIGYDRSFEWDVDLLSGYEYAVGKQGLNQFRLSLEERQYSAVLMMGWQSAFLLKSMYLCRAAGVPMMVRGDSHLLTPRSSIKRGLKELFYRVFFTQFGACLTVGAWNAEYYRHYGVPGNKIIPSPHCVDNAWFADKAEKLRSQRAELRSRWGFDAGDTVFLFVGRLTDMKHVEDFIKALSIVNKKKSVILSEAKNLSSSKQGQGMFRAAQHDRTEAIERSRSIKGLIIGDGPLRNELAKESEKISAPVVFGGFLNQTEIIQAYVAADCLVLPSDARETWGLVVNEAMACGLPCIVSDQVGCGPDMIIQGKNGMIFKCGDEDLARAMIVWQKQDLAEQVRSANSFVLQKHSCESAVHGILQGLNILS
jgi:glycosyltransferase involved in cell wall biosynthesis